MNVRTVLLTLVVVIALPAHAATSGECSPLIENASDCSMTLSTFPASGGRVSGGTTLQSAYSPLPVRVRPNVRVTLNILHRPLEQVTVSETYNQQAKPDPFGTILSQLGKTAAGLTVSLATFSEPAKATTPPVTTARITLDRFRTLPTPSKVLAEAKQLKDDYDAFVNVTLPAIASDQATYQADLKKQNALLSDISKEVAAAQRFIPVVNGPSSAGTFEWNENSRDTFNRCVAHLGWRLGAQVADPGDDPCQQTPSASTSPLRNTPLGSPPSPAALQRLSLRVQAASTQYADLVKRLQALVPQLKPSEVPVFDDAGVQQALDALNDRQSALSDGLKALQTARAPIVAYSDALDAWSQSTTSPVVQTVVIAMHPSTSGSSGQQKVDAKVQAQPLLTKETATDVGTASITFVRQPWEVSAGIMWSNVLGRTFQNSPVIVNGQPKLDANGKQINLVTESTTSPTIDVIALVHYRFIEWSGFWNRRIALLGSAGIGTGTNGSGADFAAGGSLAIGNLMLSPLLHFTRDVRLTNGVQVGDNLGPSPPPPPTERYWVHKLGIGLTYVIPIT